ncbi:sulfotransferase family 2 domain-containing protein [Okeania sp. SIO2B3]|uniref:sulfotransferase family 2 domain-containing protein n=1 Tax=Okeania sp. SIO2B3 TaxID=2607784 RepID=UPI0025E14D3C|nr:sulfotransferase family 2 domain-containing protein [Okeania sp. SIO2B3]
MIISHKYKFIFLKTKKTGGTSIEISLSRYCGENDIITPISIEDEAIRKLLGKKPQNYNMIESGEEKKYYNHIPAEEVKNQIGNSVWKSYYKFCFERNPFEQAISMYFFQTKSRSMENFDNWLKKKKICKLSQL